jgi:hypothetical protein
MNDSQILQHVESYVQAASADGRIHSEDKLPLYANILFVLSSRREPRGGMFDGLPASLRSLSPSSARSIVQAECDRMLEDWRARHPR